MAQIPDSRNFIDQNQTRYRAPVSEAYATSQGAATNFIMNRMRSYYMYEYAGPFRPLLGGEGGVFFCSIDLEIVGLGVRCRTTGNSGSSIFDIHLEQGTTDQGTQWAAQKLVLPATSSIQNAYIDYVSGNNNSNGGIVFPTWSTRNFSQGDILRVDCDSNASGANDLIIQFDFRPR